MNPYITPKTRFKLEEPARSKRGQLKPSEIQAGKADRGRKRFPPKG